jgi:hypothetical protein
LCQGRRTPGEGGTGTAPQASKKKRKKKGKGGAAAPAHTPSPPLEQGRRHAGGPWESRLIDRSTTCASHCDHEGHLLTSALYILFSCSQTLAASLATTTIDGESLGGGPREEESTDGGSLVAGADPQELGGQLVDSANVPSHSVDCKEGISEVRV